MFRRIVICLPLTVFLLTVSIAEAQQPKKIPRVGFLAAPSRHFFRLGPKDSDKVFANSATLKERTF